MNKAELEQRISTVCRMRRLSRHTERTYTHWITRFSRHVSTCAHLLAQGTDIRRIQEWLGHNSVETTMIYTHCVPRESGDVISPLDALTQTKIIPFAPPHPQRMEWSA